MATRIKSSQITDGAIVAADLHSAIAINTTQSGTFGSVIVDNYTLGSNRISTNQANSYNGDLMLDSAGEIILDADGGDILIKDNGSHKASITMNSNVQFSAKVANEDILFRGVKAGTPNTVLTALTLDMSNDGRATFNENVSVGGDLTVTGNLQVDGTQTVLNTATLSVEDLNITVASGASNNTQADGAGITVGGSNATILYDGTNDEWDFNKDVVVSGELTSTGQLSVDHTGNLSGALKLGDSSTIASETGIYLRTSSIGHFAIPNTGTIRFRDTTPLSYLDIEGTGDIRFYESNSGTPQVGMHWDYLQGRLGIGSTDPSSPLTVAIDTSHTTTNITSSHTSNIDVYNPLAANTDEKGSIITFSDNYYDSTNNVYPKSTRAGIKGGTDSINNDASGYLALYTNNISANNLKEQMRITKDGYVGIGLKTPVSTLDVTTTNSVGSVFRKDFNGPVADTLSKVAVTLWGQDHDDASVGTGTDQFGPMLGFGARIDDGDPNTGDIRAGISYSYNGDLTFHAKAGASVADGSYERIRIDGATGNVGIGAKVPSENLDIQSGTVDDHVHVVIGPSATHSTNKESHLQLWRTDGNQSRTKVGELMTDIPLPAEGTRGTSLWSYQTLRLVTANSGAGHIVFAPKGTVRMRIDDAGNVGVGSVFTTTAPPDKQFHVKGAGDIKIEDSAGGSAHLHITSSTNGLKNSEWRLKTSGSTDEFYIDHVYTDNDGTSDVAVTGFNSALKITGNTQNIYNSNSQVDIRPTLNLDFANSKTLHKDITFYRDSYATYYDKNGTLRIAGRNEPRFDHNPSTGESRGLLIERAGSNLTSSANVFNGWYGQNRVMVIPNATLSPSGKMDASMVIDDPDGSTNRKELWRSFTAVSGEDYTFSFYVKKDYKTKIAIVWYGDNGVFGGTETIFDVSNGTVNSAGFANYTNIEYVGNGWYRCIARATAGASAAGYYGFYMVDESSSSTSYIGTRGQGIYVYGAQFENTDNATSYMPNLDTFTSRSSKATYQDEDGLLRTAIQGQERHGYFWSDKKKKYVDGGFTIERASTNLLYDSSVSSDLYGDLMSFEAKWTITDSSRDVLAPDGSPFTTKGVAGTTGNHWYWKPSPVTYVNGESYTHSAWVRCPDGQTGTITMGVYPQTGATTVTLTDRWERVEVSFDYSTSASNPYVGFVSPSNSSTFYFWGFQVEQQPRATSYISTQGSAMTRAADLFGSSSVYRPLEHARIDNLDKADWFDEDRATVLVDFDSNDGFGTDTVVVSITEKGLNNGHRIPWLTGSGGIRGSYWAGAQYGVQHYYTGGVPTASQKYATAWNLSNNEFRSALDGDSHADTTNFTVHSSVKANQINIGGNYGSDRPFTGHIKRLAIWDKDHTRLQLIALTEND